MAYGSLVAVGVALVVDTVDVVSEVDDGAAVLQHVSNEKTSRAIPPG